MYRIEFDESQSVLRLTLTGFWDADVVSRFSTELLDKAAEVSRGQKVVSILSDGTAFPVQSAEVTEGFVGLMNRISPLIRGRMAIVASGPLNKMQAQRIFTDPKIEVFGTEAAAWEWLNEGKR